jgi:hypothetical protein
MFDLVHGDPTIRFADNDFAYDAQKEKVYGLDGLKNLLDLETGEKIGKSLTLTSLVNTPGYENQTVGAPSNTSLMVIREIGC